MKELFFKAVKFCLTGGLNTVIDFAVTTLLNAVFSVSLLIAQPVGYLLGMANSFIINKTWTFQTKEGTGKELLKFVVVNGALLGFKLLFTQGMLHHFTINETLLNLIATVVVIAINFPLSNFWVFKKP